MKLTGLWVVIVLGCGKGEPEHAAEQPLARPEPVAAIRVDAGVIDTLPPDAAIAIEVTGRQLYEDYEASVEAADAKYRGRLVRLHGIVKDHGSTVLEIQAPHQDHINAWFMEQNASDIHLLKPYDEVFVRCIGDGMLDVPILRRC